MGDYEQDELELGDYLEILKRRWAWFLLPILILPAAAYFYSSSQEERFNASAEVLLNDSVAQDVIGVGIQETYYIERFLENEIRLATSDQASEEMAGRLGIDPDEVPGYSVTADGNSDVLVFSASSVSPEESAVVANVAAESYVFLKQQDIQQSIVGAIASLEQTLLELQTDRETTREELVRLESVLASATEETRASAQAAVDREASRISGPLTLIDARISATADSITQLNLSGELAAGGTARIVSTAFPPTSSSNAPPSRNLVLGLVVGGILGAGLALLRENLDNKIRSTDDFERLGLVPLGAIPKASSKANKNQNLATITLTDPDSPQAQAHQKTQAALRFLTAQHDLSNVLITSPKQSEGKTTVASNLSIAMARSNTRTVLVDLDLRRPRIHSAFGLPQSPGITSAVLDGVDVTEAASLVSELDNHLAVVPTGALPPHPASFISSPSFTDTMKLLSKLSDFTVFDAPPTLPVADTLSLAQSVDGVILVAYAGETKRNDLERAAESLVASGARLLGAVLLGADIESSGYEYYSRNDSLERV